MNAILVGLLEVGKTVKVKWLFSPKNLCKLK